MRKEVLVEDFMKASNEYSTFYNALLELYEEDSIMMCLLGRLNELVGDYYKSMMRIYNAGMTLDEAFKLLA